MRANHAMICNEFFGLIEVGKKLILQLVMALNFQKLLAAIRRSDYETKSSKVCRELDQ